MKCYGERGEHIWNILGIGYIENNKNPKTPTSLTSPKEKIWPHGEFGSPH